MLGHDHALSGALAFVAVAPLLPVSGYPRGALARLAGDMLTHDGCPLLYPVSRYKIGLLPEPVRITTNKLAERWVISPLLLAGLAYFIYRDAAPALTTAASRGWP
jgi:hypothetical protein